MKQRSCHYKSLILKAFLYGTGWHGICWYMGAVGIFYNFHKGLKMKTIIKNVSTKLEKNGAAHETALTINFDGATEDQIHELASQALVVLWQSKVRRAGAVPKTDVLMVKDHGTRSSTMSPDQAIAVLLAKHNGDVNAVMAELRQKAQK